ncbi:DUF2524 family protein [Halalkalibacter sp. APA_J-10(15)]|uniref:DUF2524 family protein n=1 Tax=unclassified Halalkalibacter TaxID=2893063 RepID=UPI001FF2352D|nr:DUF2524 family protein [Halalkalibacter sp. APA_J-10(15)]MCK0472064.1 YtzC family protein [Halalkalibacter sp. APA_J-10(15)]
MTERSHVKEVLNRFNHQIEMAEEIFRKSQTVNWVDDSDYIQTQENLQAMHNELDTLIRTATPEQREELTRKQQQIRQLQNHMILKR